MSSGLPLACRHQVVSRQSQSQSTTQKSTSDIVSLFCIREQFCCSLSQDMRGIRNTTGVSCHLACALQVLCHSVPLLTETLKTIAIELTPVLENPNWLQKEDLQSYRLIHALGKILGELRSSDGGDDDDGCHAVDPASLYSALEEVTSLDSNDIGDAATAIHPPYPDSTQARRKRLQ